MIDEPPSVPFKVIQQRRRAQAGYKAVRVPIAEAQAELARLLRTYTREDIHRRTGLAAKTLRNIEYATQPTVDWSTLAMLKRFK
jgi:hypothetical protein